MANMFALILVIATLVTGLLWCLDKFIFAPKRRERQAAAQAATGEQLDKKTLKKVGPKPGWLETGASVFPVLAIVLIVRSFIYEPFQIPSGSMMPTLLIGDFILVEKFAYGIKDPIYQKTLIETGHPKRGDIVVFKYPEDPRPLSARWDYRAIKSPTIRLPSRSLFSRAAAPDRPAATRCR